MDEITPLIEQLGTGGSSSDEEALALLAIQGRRAVEPLLSAAAHGEPRRRAAVLTALGRIGDQRARRTILAALADGEPQVRAAAATASSAYPSAETLARLRSLLKKEPGPEVRLRSVATLVDLFNRGMVEALDPLLSSLKDPAEDRRVRLEAMKVLATLPPGEARMIAASLAGDADATVARGSARFAEPAAGGDVEGLAGALSDIGSADYFTYRRAATALASLGEAGIPTLVRALSDRAADPAACARVASVLREVARGRERVVARFLDETTETTPLALMVDILGESTDRTAVYHLKSVIDRLEPGGSAPDPVRETILAKAHYHLARAGSRVAIDSLKRAMTRQRGRLMGEILMAVSEIGGKEELVDLLWLYGHEQGWMRERIKESFQKLMKKCRVAATDRVFQRLDEVRAGWLAEILGPLV